MVDMVRHESHPCGQCVDLLNEALNLTVRGRTLDGINRRQAQLDASMDGDAWLRSGMFDRYVERHNAESEPWRHIEARSLTPQLWTEDQFARDLHDWETRARKHMMESHHA